MSNERLQPCLQSILDKVPKFAMTQNIIGKTFNDVEVGLERAVYALRWKLDIESRRAGQSLPSSSCLQLKPRFADNDAAVPRPASVETERTVSKLKRKILGIYRNHRVTVSNVLPEQEKALKELSLNSDVIVKPSDKCKGLVIMDKGEYVDKALGILADYEPIKTNPTPKVEAVTKRVIKTVMDNKVDKHLVQALLPQGSRTAEMYGLPKNHKESVPLRPIVSACGDPLDKLSWFLERILTQLLKYVPAHLPNTDTYLDRVKETYPNGFPPGTTVFSLDVKNLYGNIPIDEAVQAAINLLKAHKESINLFGLSWLDVEPLLHHCLTNSYCRFGQSFFKQKVGLPMGSRIAPPVAIIFMGAIEQVFLSTRRAQPSMYMRYIDDCFCVWPHSSEELTEYFDYVNTIHPTITFTIERSDTYEPPGQLPFLDTLIRVDPSGHFTTELYIKPVAAPIILSFDSAQPFKLKKAVAKSQFLRALRVSSDPLSAKRSTDKVNELFLSNGYPSRWLLGVARQAQRQNQKIDKNTDPKNRNKKDKIFVSLPFIDETLTRKVEATLRSVNLDLTAAWVNGNTLTKRLVHSALEPPPCRAGNRSCRTCNSGLRGRCTAKNVVYEITCEMCSPPKKYIGETKRCVRYRFDEHFRDGANHTDQTPFGDHMTACHPSEPAPQLSITILRRCKDGADRKIAEALAIRDRNPKLNSQIDTWPVLH